VKPASVKKGISNKLKPLPGARKKLELIDPVREDADFLMSIRIKNGPIRNNEDDNVYGYENVINVWCFSGPNICSYG
jgi:hypothetical protein